ncbi:MULTISPECIES: hypothetical protein [Catenuloplanes]|uniref:Uncharacterized protein n=1 Tax=Catenuloplanes niger TaxID=587534 RepID=A0AAE3ZZS8_9ACTN|nr:hypothetical protein [Catenuloplanes niger]MDR7326963.1 hypothetical protein [Catenuloplanes niger]
MSRYETLGHASERYDVGLQLIFQRPDFRPYIFERKSIDLTGDDLARVLIIADLMAGAADYAVRVGSRFPDDTGSDWIGVAQAMTMQPVFRKLTLERPYEFPDLIKFFQTEVDDQTPPPTS